MLGELRTTGNISKLITDVCLRFAFFLAGLKELPFSLLLLRKKEKLSPLLIHEVGVGGVAHFNKHVTSSFCPVNTVHHSEGPLSIGLEPKQLLSLENSRVSRSHGQVRPSCPSVRLESV